MNRNPVRRSFLLLTACNLRKIPFPGPQKKLLFLCCFRVVLSAGKALKITHTFLIPHNSQHHRRIYDALFQSIPKKTLLFLCGFERWESPKDYTYIPHSSQLTTASQNLRCSLSIYCSQVVSQLVTQYHLILLHSLLLCFLLY